MDQTKRYIFAALAAPLVLTKNVYADTAGVGQVQNFLQNAITAVAGLAGLVATAFFVLGGLKYITSSGNPQSLERAKRTILFSAVGLAIVIAAFVLSSIVSNLASNAFGS